MEKYRELVISIAETIVYVKRLTDEQYQEWMKDALELADESSSEVAEKVLEVIDAYRKREISACS